MPNLTPLIYGPIRSRRHGLSLGINLGIEDKKICTWGCLYCQCGMGVTRDFKKNEILHSAKTVIQKLKTVLPEIKNLHSVTFAGNTEPTTHPEFLKIVNDILDLRTKNKASWVLNCLSNGSELDQSSIVQACQLLDETWIKLDCGEDILFKKLNRPLPRIGSIDDHLARIKKISPIFIQTLVWSSPSRPELSNWTLNNQKALLECYLKLKPKKIHLTTLAREPASKKLTQVPKNELFSYAEHLRRHALDVEVFS